MKSAEFYIKHLDMEPHIEGGYFKECLLSGDTISYRGMKDRRLWSSIYFLLREGEVSHLHIIDSDEVWYFHDGNPLTIYMISPEGELSAPKLGLDAASGEQPQILVPKGYIFGAAMENEGYSLVGCMCAPAFRYETFELPTRDEIVAKYPEYAERLQRLMN